MTEVRPRVLIVDDVEANLVALEAQLGRLRCELVRAPSGNEALKLLLKGEFAAMLLDVHMPEMDGYEVARYARESPASREVPIIFVTAMHETPENALRGYGAGAVDFLFKPIDPFVLRSKVQVFLDLYLGRRWLADEIEAHKRTHAELEAFSYSVSHDLRAPLRRLQGFSEALDKDCGENLDATAKDYVGRIRTAAERMNHLIEDLLQLSRTGRAALNVRPLDLVPLAHAVIAELRRNEPGRSVEYVAARDARVEGDARLMRIALENLLGNAWKFTVKQPQARIELGQRRDGDAVVYLCDASSGVTAERSGPRPLRDRARRSSSRSAMGSAARTKAVNERTGP